MTLLQNLAGKTASDKSFIAVVSPSVRSLHPKEFETLTGFLLNMGAKAVYPVDAGIPEFTRLSALAIAEKGHGLHILSACPMAIRFVTERFPSFASRILDVRSPMALQAAKILREKNIITEGFALALTPCRYKRLEAANSGIDLRVVTLKELAAACGDRGVDPFSLPPSPYGCEVPPKEDHCAIATSTVSALRSLGISAESVQLDGAQSAANWLSALSPRDADGTTRRCIVAEITFCVGGCSTKH